MPRPRPLPVLCPVLSGVLLLCRGAFGLETVVIGQGGALDWQGRGSAPVATLDAEYRAPLDPDNPGGTPKLLVGNAPGDLIEFSSGELPRGLLPRRLVECLQGSCGEANIADGALARGGTIQLPTYSSFSLQYKKPDLKEDLAELVSSAPGGEEDAVELKNFDAFGQLLILDLGARFSVNRLRFYPRNTVQKSPATPFQDDFLRAYELFTNDGLDLTREGVQVWSPLVLERNNKTPVVDVVLDPPRYVQSVRLKSLTQFNWEIDEFEVYGEGFLPTALYLSNIFDAGGPATWVRLRWDEEVLGDPGLSQVQIRTRTGTDDSPFVFTRSLRGKPNAEEIPYSVDDPSREMTRAEFESLPKIDSQGREWEPASVQDDLVNWSPFSTPFPAGAANGPGSPILSPGPRRYLQFQVLFQSGAPEAVRALRSLSIDFLRPPLADELVGEIYPRQVEPSSSQPFVYAVRPVMKNAGLRGFDTVELTTPTRVERLDRLELLDREGRLVAGRDFAGLQDTAMVDGFQIAAVDRDRFKVRFPLVKEDGAQARIWFHTSILTYSTNFSSAASLSDEPQAAQAVSAGDAGLLGEGDDPDFSGTTVLSPQVQRGELLARVEVNPALFTPNGDGINDQAVLRYSLLSLSLPRPLSIRVHDLAGRLVRVLYEGTEANGRYEDKSWDGRDGAGRLVAPGVYLVRIEARGDAAADTRTRTVSLAY